MALDDAGRNLIDFFKVILKVFIILMGLQILFYVTDTKIDLPFMGSFLNSLGSMLKNVFGAFGGFGFSG